MFPEITQKCPVPVDKEDQAKFLNYRANLAHGRKEFDVALVLYNEALQILANPESLYMIGLTYFHMGDYKKALEYFDKLKSDKTLEYINARLYYGGMTAHRLGYYEKAFACFAAFLEINVSSVCKESEYLICAYSFQQLGFACSQQGKYDQALDYHKQSQEYFTKGNSKENFLENVGAIYYRQDKLNEAEKCFDAVLLENSTSRASLRFKGYLKLIANDTQRAAIFFNKTLESENINTQADKFQLQGLINFIKNPLFGSNEYFEKAEKLYNDPTLVQDITNRCGMYFHTGKILLAHKHVEKAKEFFNKALQLKKDCYGIQQEMEKLKILSSNAEKKEVQSYTKTTLNLIKAPATQQKINVKEPEIPKERVISLHLTESEKIQLIQDLERFRISEKKDLEFEDPEEEFLGSGYF